MKTTTIAKARSAAGPFVQALRQLFAVAENYPDLKANQNFLSLQQELANTEDRIQAARRFYNNNVQDYNRRVQSFPSVIMARLGNFTPEFDVDVAPRDASGARLFDARGDEERIRAAHSEGYAAVGGSLELRRRPKELEPYVPGGGRNPAFAHPLVCPSLLPPLEPNAEVAGLPAWRPEGDEPWVYDARITLRPRLRLRKPT